MQTRLIVVYSDPALELSARDSCFKVNTPIARHLYKLGSRDRAFLTVPGKTDHVIVGNIIEPHCYRLKKTN